MIGKAELEDQVGRGFAVLEILDLGALAGAFSRIAWTQKCTRGHFEYPILPGVHVGPTNKGCRV